MESAAHSAMVGRSHTLKETPKLMSSMADPTPLATPASTKRRGSQGPYRDHVPRHAQKRRAGHQKRRDRTVAADVRRRVEELAGLFQKHGVQQQRHGVEDAGGGGKQQLH